MDRDTLIESYLHESGTCLRFARICGRGAIVASIIRRGEVLATGRGTSLEAALDGLAIALSGKAAA